MGGAGFVRSWGCRGAARWLSRELDAATELSEDTAVAGALAGNGGVGLLEWGGGGGGVLDGGVDGAGAGAGAGVVREVLLELLELLRESCTK